MTIPSIVGRISRFACDSLQDFDKRLDLFFGVVRGEAGADEPTAVPDADLFGERRSVEVAGGYEEAVLQHPHADLFGRMTLHPEGYGGSLADAIGRGPVEVRCS